MGVMVQDLQAKGLRPPPQKKKKTRSCPELLRPLQGEPPAFFPSSAPAQA